MKFVPRDVGAAAEASSGGGGKGMRREIAWLAVGLAGLVGAVYFGVGLVVDLALPFIPVQWEADLFAGSTWLGRGVERATEAAPGKVSEEQRWAEGVLGKLAVEPGVAALPYRLVIMEHEKQPNAFALPGGTVAVTRGLLDVVGRNEVALAFVLSHELGHFAQRDHLRGMGRSVGRAVAWALIFGGTPDDLTGRLDQLLALEYSRRQEAGADVFGLRLVQHAYGTTEGSDRLFQWLEENQRSPGWVALLSSHPGTAGRLQVLREVERDR